jgi:exosortase
LRNWVRALGWRGVLTAIGLVGLILWVFWPSIVELAEIWESVPQYSHGYLVPLFAVALLWLRRDRCDPTKMQPTWWGAAIVAAGCLIRLGGGYYYYFWLERIALLPIVVGLAMTLGGWAALRWSWPSIAFLIFMLPLPSGLAGAMAHPLQRIGTLASSYLLEVLGFPAVTEGNVIALGQNDLGVVEACSGLRMLITFFAASAAVAMLSRQSLLVRVLLFLCAAPIAVVVNVLRITVTGVLYETAGSRVAELVFHDLAGWLMIPMALGLLWLANAYLARLFTVNQGFEHDAVRRSLQPVTAAPARRKAMRTAR